MTEFDAAAKAEKILLLMTQHQPNFLAPSHLTNPDQASKLAQSLAAFRQELTKELMKQPY
jgi:hypothetical protein